ncbi:MAG: TRIC cation channel family protein [Actinomycetes bacterium]
MVGATLALLASAIHTVEVQPPNNLFNLPSFLEIVAVTTGALTGALHATHRKLDPMGVMVVAICTGVGGGAIRDVLLNSGIPTFLVSPTLLANAILAAAVATLFARPMRHFTPVMSIVDTLVIGVWVVIGVQKALLVGLNPTAAMFVGVVACSGGSLLRDLLCKTKPEVLQPGTFFAAAALAGAGAYIACALLGAPTWVSITATMVIATGLRAASAIFGWETPVAPVLSEAAAVAPST